MGAKRQLAILLLVSVVHWHPFRLQGLELGMSDTDVEALLGKALPSSRCHEGEYRQYEYQDPQRQEVAVTFDTDLRAYDIEGNRLELRDGKAGAWVKILQVGDSEKSLEALPEVVRLNLPSEEVYLRRGATLSNEQTNLIGYSYWDPKGQSAEIPLTF